MPPQGLKKAKKQAQLQIKFTAKLVGTSAKIHVTVKKTETLIMRELRNQISEQFTQETGQPVTISELRSEDGTLYYDDSLVKDADTLCPTTLIVSAR